MTPNGHGVPNLGGTQQVVVTSRRVLFPASVEVRDNGLTSPGCDKHIEVVDVITGTMYLVPINNQQAKRITEGISA